jgi:AbrB family looped-hinge helix DNA binding protein
MRYACPMKHFIQLGERGRLVLPAAVRRELNIQEGEQMILTYEDGVITIQSARAQVQSVRGIYREDGPSTNG